MHQNVVTLCTARRARLRPTSGGFTLIELMVVVAILGILSAGAVTMFDSDPTGEGARKLAAMLQQARRKATELGPVPAVLAATEGRARTRVKLWRQSERAYVTTYWLDDDSGTWEEDNTTQLPSGVLVFGITYQPRTLEGLGTPTALGDAAEPTVDFFPDGTATGHTWYLRHLHKDKATRFRVFVMPLSGQAEVGVNW